MREIQVMLFIDWEDYDDVHPELVLEDTGMLDQLKRGVNWKIIEDNQFKKVGRDWVPKETSNE